MSPKKLLRFFSGRRPDAVIPSLAAMWVLALTLLMTFGGIAQAAPNATNVEVKPPAKELAPDDAYTVSLAAGRILTETDKALAALEDGEQEKAIEHAKQGLMLVRIIERIIPSATVETEIKSGDLVYRDQDQIGPTLVTIFDELDNAHILSKVANPLANKSKKNAKAEAFDFTGLTYSAVKLRIPLAKRNLKRAKDSLANNNANVAKDALREILDDGLVFVWETVDLPLERAADNLKLAEDALRDGRTDQARADLLLSLDALKEYEALVGRNRSQEVQQMRDEITKTASEIFAAKNVGAKSKIADSIRVLWERSTSWFRD